VTDPLLDGALVPDRSRELFKAFCACATGCAQEDVLAAAINLLLNGIRQSCATQLEAAMVFDELSAKAKHLLLEAHYHGDGTRRNIFPFTQVLEVNNLDNWPKNKFNR
jgi:hypothetical protein